MGGFLLRRSSFSLLSIHIHYSFFQFFDLPQLITMKSPLRRAPLVHWITTCGARRKTPKNYMGKRRRRNHSETRQEKKRREWMRDVEKSLERERLWKTTGITAYIAASKFPSLFNCSNGQRAPRSQSPAQDFLAHLHHNRTCWSAGIISISEHAEARGEKNKKKKKRPESTFGLSTSFFTIFPFLLLSIYVCTTKPPSIHCDSMCGMYIYRPLAEQR